MFDNREVFSSFDYLPTQYLCEYIKFLEFDAIEYNSSMNKGRYNLAIFSDEKLVCKTVEFLDVTDVSYNMEIID
ncbi:RES family NAD+ phosphorylase [uncultured Chryseobacterium sp.]|uniref:RES family NAD+ phosphorylase n=1 Tax=uncultured Chryseobacterium sp. TaxID=259322 RepID=UPI00345C09CE